MKKRKREPHEAKRFDGDGTSSANEQHPLSFCFVLLIGRGTIYYRLQRCFLFSRGSKLMVVGLRISPRN